MEQDIEEGSVTIVKCTVGVVNEFKMEGGFMFAVVIVSSKS